MPKKVVIVGAGLGGLALAIDLAAKGIEVAIFEKNSRPGGKMGEARWQGFRFDTGPSLLTMPFVLDAVLQRAGSSLDSTLQLKKLEPICRYFYPHHHTIDASHDLDHFAAQLAKFEPDAGRKLRRYLRYAERLYSLAAPLFLFSDFPNPRHFITKTGMSTLLRTPQLDPMRSVHRAHTRFFQDPRVQQLFDRYATYAGASPYAAPATFNIISHVEYSLGSFYPYGGIYKIAELLSSLAAQRGVALHYNEGVASIIARRGTIQGVITQSGREVPAQIVVSNVDALFTYSQLLSEPSLTTRLLRRQSRSLSGIVLLCAVKRQTPTLAHHNIFFSRNYREEFSDIFDSHIMPRDPTIYLSITSKSDPSHAPPGCENWFLLINVHPATTILPNPDELLRQLLDRLNDTGVVVDRNDILWHQVRYPSDLGAETNTGDGALYGAAPHSPWSAFLRPPNRSRSFKGLYLVGGSVHPGGGIPLALLSGLITGQIVAADLGLSVSPLVF